MLLIIIFQSDTMNSKLNGLNIVHFQLQNILTTLCQENLHPKLNSYHVLCSYINSKFLEELKRILDDNREFIENVKDIFVKHFK
jgi:hypothetical protein